MKPSSRDKQKQEGVLLFLFKQIWQWDKGMFTSMFLYTIFFSLTPMIAIYVPKLIIDALQADDWNNIPIILIVGFIISALAAYMIDFLMGNYRMRFNAIRYKLIERLNLTTMTMVYPLTEDADILDQLETITNTLLNPHRGAGGIMQKLLTIAGSLVGVLGFTAIISSLNIWVLLLLFMSIVLTYWLSHRSGKYEEERSDEYHGANRRHYYSTNTTSDFNYGKDIRLYQLGGLLLAKRNEAAENVMAITRAISNHKFSNELIIAFIGLLRDILIYGFITLRFLNGDLTAGDFILYTGATSAVVLWLSDTMRDIGFIQVNSKYVRKYQDFLKEARVPSKDGISIKANESNYEIEFKGVSFKYAGSERLVLENLNLKMAAGERLALVGENGAGKTTIVKLLTRLYEPTSGEILLNGVNIQEYSYTSYQYLISTVLQDAKIFPFTIADNIMLGQEYDRERLQDAIEKAGLNSTIDSLKDGVDTWLLKVLNENGIDLSGGQRQKLYFARSLYNDCPIIVLDEPTASLDPLAEYEMYQSFNQTLGNKSALYISHRLASTRFCDNIAFLDGGRITEFGKHEDLVKNGGSYADLFEIQAHYYRKDKQITVGEEFDEEL